MLNSKQRKYLKSMANGLKPIAQLGKDGVTEAFLKQLDIMLENKELVKVNVLETNMLDAKGACNDVCKAINAEFVQAIGRKFVIYKESREKEKDEKIRLPR
ncbi:YhbY family RNA-binding protein [Helicovermis profundi]|uniref:YhbY family RNA-binding protein n=1 Tax=Helicovermis profundi TaxID=3065157 RepID=A0AAU9EEQ3_9FIRM|nr:YhbY family RNA-binding protein [Clostridia bacterium S502]